MRREGDGALGDLLATRGYDIEHGVATTDTSGVGVARGAAGRELVTVLPGAVDPEALRVNEGWDLPLRGAEAVEVDGIGVALFESLPHGVPATVIRRSRNVPPYAGELLDRVAVAHADRQLVGRLHPALVFADPATGSLVAVAQRPLRAYAAAAKPEGSVPLFGLTHATPAVVRGERWMPEDDVYQVAALLWRWRHGRSLLEGLDQHRQLEILNGSVPAARAADDLDAVLLHALAFERRDRASLEDLRGAVATAAW